MRKKIYFMKIVGLGLAGALVFGGCGDSGSSREEGQKLLADAAPGGQERAEMRAQAMRERRLLICRSRLPKGQKKIRAYFFRKMKRKLLQNTQGQSRKQQRKTGRNILTA